MRASKTAIKAEAAVAVTGSEMPSEFLKDRKKVAASSLSGPRVYSTDLLANHLILTDVDGSVREAARALKIKILTKGVVVLNSSHLMDPLGAALVARNPDLLSGEGLLPAFRVGDATFKVPLKENLPSYAAVGMGEKELADHQSFLERNVSQVMPWESRYASPHSRRADHRAVKPEAFLKTRPSQKRPLERNQSRALEVLDAYRKLTRNSCDQMKRAAIRWRAACRFSLAPERYEVSAASLTS